MRILWPILIFALYAINNQSIAETYKFVGTSFTHILEKDSSGRNKGIGAELATKIMSNLGHDIEIQMYPWKRAQRMVKNGQADVLIGPYKTQKREEFFDFNTYHFYQDYMIFYSRVNETFTWNGELSALRKFNIGLMAGWVYGDKFDNYKSQLSTVTLYSFKSCFGMLLKKRIDLCALNQRNAQQYLSTNKERNKFKKIATPISSTKGFYGFSKQKDLQDLRRKFDQELKRLIDNKEVYKMNHRYGLTYESGITNKEN